MLPCAFTYYEKKRNKRFYYYKPTLVITRIAMSINIIKKKNPSCYATNVMQQHNR